MWYDHVNWFMVALIVIAIVGGVWKTYLRPWLRNWLKDLIS